MAASTVDLWAFAFSKLPVTSSLLFTSRFSLPEDSSSDEWTKPSFSEWRRDFSQSTNDLSTFTRHWKGQENMKGLSNQYVVMQNKEQNQRMGGIRPTWSDDPLIEVAWDKAAKFGSAFWVPWESLDKVVTYIKQRKRKNKPEATCLTPNKIFKIRINYTGPYHAFKQIWSLQITVIVDKYVNKDLRFPTYFLKHPGNRWSSQKQNRISRLNDLNVTYVNKN